MLSEKLLLPKNDLSAPLDLSYMLLYKNNQRNKQIGAWHTKRAINFGQSVFNLQLTFGGYSECRLKCCYLKCCDGAT